MDEKDCKATFLYFDINNEKKKVWIVCVFPCQNLRRNTLSAIIESPSGEVIHVDVKDAMDYMEDWERWGREEYWYWTAEEKAVYHMVYQMNPTRIFPDEDTMPQERALELAIKSVEDKYGISSDKINANFRVDYNLVPGWYGTIKEDAWYIVFRPQDKSAYNYQIIIKAKEGDAVIRTDRWIPEM